MEYHVIQVEERPPLLLNIPLSIQHLFAMFGSTVLVPFLFKVNPTTCLFMNGIGTLLYLIITRGKIPSYLGSSFAFISPVLAIIATSGYSSAQSGFIVFGLLFILFSLIIAVAYALLFKKTGERQQKVLSRYLFHSFNQSLIQIERKICLPASECIRVRIHIIV